MKKCTKTELQEMLNSCVTMADFCRSLDLKPMGANYRIAKKIISDNSLDTSMLLGIHWKKGQHVKGKPQRALSEILTENSPYSNYYRLKERLFNEGLKERRCESCGKTQDEVTLELHHVNGNPLDNRIENLNILCPNCHSKTPNWRGKGSNRFIPTRRTHDCWKDTVISEEEALAREEMKKIKRRETYKNPQLKKSTIFDIDQTCVGCGKLFHNKKRQNYCSKDCYDEHRSTGNRVGVLDLIKKLQELKGNFTAAGKFFGVTDNAVRKWCKLYKISDKSEDYKNSKH